jgi:hypothetical protein
LELRQDVRAADAGFDPDHIGKPDLGREQQLFDKADEGVLLEILLCSDGRRLVQIRPRGIGEAPGYNAHLLRTRMGNGDIHLSFQ